MTSYKTTVVGAALAVATFVSQYQASGGDLARWQLWVVPALLAALGYLAKDFDKTGTTK